MRGYIRTQDTGSVGSEARAYRLIRAWYSPEFIYIFACVFVLVHYTRY